MICTDARELKVLGKILKSLEQQRPEAAEYVVRCFLRNLPPKPWAFPFPFLPLCTEVTDGESRSDVSTGHAAVV